MHTSLCSQHKNVYVRTYVPICGCEVEVGYEEADGHALAFDRRAIHQLVLGDVLRFVVCMGCEVHRFSANHRELHELNLDPYEEEINLAQYHILVVCVV